MVECGFVCAVLLAVGVCGVRFEGVLFGEVVFGGVFFLGAVVSDGCFLRRAV